MAFVDFTNGAIQPLPLIDPNDMRFVAFGDETGENAIAQPVGDGPSAPAGSGKLAIGAAALFLLLLA